MYTSFLYTLKRQKGLADIVNTGRDC